MNNEFVHKILSEKIAKDKTIIKIRIDEINLSIQDTVEFIEKAKKQLKEKGYKIYSPGEKYLIRDKEFLVENGEIMVAIE